MYCLWNDTECRIDAGNSLSKSDCSMLYLWADSILSIISRYIASLSTPCMDISLLRLVNPLFIFICFFLILRIFARYFINASFAFPPEGGAVRRIFIQPSSSNSETSLTPELGITRTAITVSTVSRLENEPFDDMTQFNPSKRPK
jgi:hypothetical protein